MSCPSDAAEPAETFFACFERGTKCSAINGAYLLKPIRHAALEAASTGYAAIARFLIDETYFARINHTWGRLPKREVFRYP